MKYILLGFLILQVHSLPAADPASEVGNGKGLKVFVHNFCNYWSKIYVCNGDTLTGRSASIGFMPCDVTSTPYTHSDSLLSVVNVDCFDVSNTYTNLNDTNLICLANSDSVFTYRLMLSQPNLDCDSTIIQKANSLVLDSVCGVQIFGNRIFIIRRTIATNNLLVYDTSLTTLIYSTRLNIEPKMISLDYSHCAVIGNDTSDAIVLLTIDVNSYSILRDTILNPMDVNPISFQSSAYKTMLLSQPGDSMVYLQLFNWQPDSYADTILYVGSGVRSHFWLGGQMHFQPEFDVTASGLDSSVIVFNTYTMQLRGIYRVNRRLRLLANPGDSDGMGYFPYAYLVPESSTNGKYYIYDNYNYTLQDSGYSAPDVVFFGADFRCAVSIDDYDDEMVKWETYPNPSTDYVNLSASGLICGRDYKIDVVDLHGNVKHTQVINAKMTLVIPVENFAPGIYLIRIHTRQGLVVQKFIKV